MGRLNKFYFEGKNLLCTVTYTSIIIYMYKGHHTQVLQSCILKALQNCIHRRLAITQFIVPLFA